MHLVSNSNEIWSHECLILKWASLPLEGNQWQGEETLDTVERRQAVLKWCVIENAASNAGLQI